jgi:hypothetical protein
VTGARATLYPLGSPGFQACAQLRTRLSVYSSLPHSSGVILKEKLDTHTGGGGRMGGREHENTKKSHSSWNLFSQSMSQKIINIWDFSEEK